MKTQAQSELRCGTITELLVGQKVTLNGWVDIRRDLGGLVFISLRDRTGTVQLVINDAASEELRQCAHQVRNEFVISVKGTVHKRSPAAINNKLKTGAIEVVVTELDILNKAKELPFNINEKSFAVSEELRLKYRYLDLRRESMQDLLHMRHKISSIARTYLEELGFYDIETPILTRNTLEGAREFIVPSRASKGYGYALPQSPQVYKQLLMASGVDRYYQIARCFRDEALRANRQPEFTQIDIEMSFVEEQDIYEMSEGLFTRLFDKILGITLTSPFARYSYDEVFDSYGSDKPDLRFGMKIKDCTSLCESLNVHFMSSVFESGGRAGILCVKNQKFSRKQLDEWTRIAKDECGASGLVYLFFKEDGSVSSPLAKFLPEDIFHRLAKIIPDLTQDDTLFMVVGEYKTAWAALGQLRLKLGRALQLINEAEHSLFWVTDFPSFEWDSEQKKWQACHHPFTSAQIGWEKLEIKDMKARAYDLVWNGEEVGGGSIRIHDYETQKKMFSLIGLSKIEIEQNFAFLLEALQLGYPPEGGIAFGLDRLIMSFAGVNSIRDVIPFPKTNKGACLMMETPSLISEKELEDLGLKHFTPEKN